MIPSARESIIAAGQAIHDARVAEARYVDQRERLLQHEKKDQPPMSAKFDLPKDMHVWITYQWTEFIAMLQKFKTRGDVELISINRTLGAMHGYVVTYQCDEKVEPPIVH